MAGFLLNRLAATVRPSVSTRVLGFSSRTWTGPPRRERFYEHDDGEPLEQNVEDKLQAVVDEAKRKQKMVKFHMIRRKMTPAGAPQRKLTWEAIEQIRYLKQEQPEEWTVQRLAEGFAVNPDVIQRVLRNKFVPSPERKMKQNAKVMALLRQQELPSSSEAHHNRETLPRIRAAALLQSGNTEGALVPVFTQTLATQETSGLVANTVVPIPALPACSAAAVSKYVTWTHSAEDGNQSEKVQEIWDGHVFTEEDLEKLREIENVTPAVQVGNEFFDSDGNFLYGI